MEAGKSGEAVRPVRRRRSALITTLSTSPRRLTASTDAIVILREDHKKLRRLFREFRSAGPDDRALRGELVSQILELLSVHTYIENEGMYPRVLELAPDLRSDILESYEEHHVADVLCAELAGLAPDAERFEARTTVLIENVEHHIKEEEEDCFPRARAALGRRDLQTIGQEMLELQSKAPHHPAQPGALKKALRAVVA